MRRSRLATLLAALAIAVAACGPPVGSPSPSAPATTGPGTTAAPSEVTDPAEIYAAINIQVQGIRGLEELEPIEPKLVSPAEMRAVLERRIQEESPPELLAAYERLYKGMDLLVGDASLEDLYLELVESQVGGLYDPTTTSLYVVSKEGAIGTVERVTYSHEYQHALQDQHFDLEKFTEGLTDQTDRQLARQAIVEGDAYTTMGMWIQRNLGAPELLELVAAGSDPEAAAVLERIPPIIREQLLFAAVQGFSWTQSLQSGGGWEAVDAAFAQPPDSTEQILHADKWAAREAPIEVTIEPDLATEMGAGWSQGLQDTFGEHQLGIWLGAGSTEAVAGWGGDRAILFDGPSGAWAIALLTEWDTAGDATAFADAAVVRLDAVGTPGEVAHRPGTTRVTVMFASDAAAAVSLDRIFGGTGV